MSHRYFIKTSELKSLVNPLDGDMWKCKEITVNEVLEAISNGAKEERSWADVINTLDEQASRQFHINRIATLHDQEFSNENHPVAIYIIFPDPDYPSFELEVKISDGNHRIAAAYVREDEELELVIAASDSSKISSVLPSAKNIV